jgi:hypothetical protein
MRMTMRKAEKANAVFEVIQDSYGISVDEEEGESIYNLSSYRISSL